MSSRLLILSLGAHESLKAVLSRLDSYATVVEVNTIFGSADCREVT